MSSDMTDQDTAPRPVVTPPRYFQTPRTPRTPQTPPASVHGMYTNIVDHAIQRLNDAARRIDAVEQQKERRNPHASRLSPFHDISADIRRNSTPLPNALADAQKSSAQPKRSEATGSRLPDLWPWLPEVEEPEHDSWVNHIDPLVQRRFPNVAEAARIEAEDEQRARAEGTIVRTSSRGQALRTKRLRIAFTCLAALAVFALVIDTVLVSIAFLHSHHTTPIINGPPTLTIEVPGRSENQASYGQSITLHLSHFSPFTSIYITHDVEEPVLLSNGNSLVQIGRSGSSSVSTVIDANSWQPGFHNIEAEDIKTHYTANATLQIVGAGPSRPSHLSLETTELDFGQDIQGANTLKPFKLSNTGTSSLSWAASSNKSWLMLTPNQGTFSKEQVISIAVQRGSLSPGEYSGKITFSSNVGGPQVLQVDMKVLPLPKNGPVLMVTPAVLSFTALDGQSNVAGQELVVSNPGTQPLTWSLTNNAASLPTEQAAFLRATGSTINWINTDVTSGTVVPGATEVVHVNVNGQSLLPDTYMDTLVFSGGQGTWNGTQSVEVSLTVQPQCGVTLSSGGMIFNAVANRGNTSNQSLGVGAAPGCGVMNWQATSSASWLTITPTNGKASAANNAIISVGVNANGLGPGTYTGNIAVIANRTTQSVTVVLTVQAPPPPGAPIMAVAPLSVNFSTTQGQPNPAGQTVLISNSGQSTLRWMTQVNQLASTWLGASPTGGAINAGQTGQLTVNVNTNGLTPGTYNGQITISGYDTTANQNPAGGNPQVISVQLQVYPPCVLQQPSSSALAFTAVAGEANPAAQAVVLTASGNCVWPLSWKTSITTAASWLSLSPASGSFGSGSLSATLNVAADTAGLGPGTYTTKVLISASDSNALPAQGSPQSFTVTLTIQPPCQLALSSTGLSFTVAQGQTSGTQNVNLSESGTCARPVSWTATGDSKSTSWLVLSPASGADSGSGGTFGVSINASALPPGTYNASITVSASGSGGAAVQGSPRTIPVSVTVTGFSVSGTVYACADSNCLTPVPLLNAAVSLVNASGNQIMNVTSNATTGGYTFTNVPSGTYTVSVAGLDSAGIHVVGSAQITVNGNMQNVNVNAIPG